MVIVLSGPKRQAILRAIFTQRWGACKAQGKHRRGVVVEFGKPFAHGSPHRSRTMSNIPQKFHFEDAYKKKAPWDIPGPQPAFVAVADQITGGVLDVGCGTGENAMFFAKRGNNVTALDYVEEPIKRADRKSVRKG